MDPEPVRSISAVRLIVFDLDGTLVDSRRDLANAANQLLAENGAPPHTEAAIGRMVGDGAATLVARAFEGAGVPQPANALTRFLEIYDGHLLDHTRPYEGVESLLRDLEPRLPLAVLTNKPLAATRTILDGLGLARFFRAGVLGGDGPFPRKPDPAGLVHLMHNAQVAGADTLLVGDSLVDCRTAHAATARACLARYGFGSHDVALSILGPADLEIEKPIDLLKYV